MVSLFPGILEVFFPFVNQWLIVTDINSHCQDQQEMGGLKLCTLFFLFLSGALLKNGWNVDDGLGVFTCVHQTTRHIIKAKKSRKAEAEKTIWVRACRLRMLELGSQSWLCHDTQEQTSLEQILVNPEPTNHTIELPRAYAMLTSPLSL